MSDIIDIGRLADTIAVRVADELELRSRNRTPVLLTPEAYATKYGIAVKTLANLRSKGGGPKYIKVGGRVRYPDEPVQP